MYIYIYRNKKENLERDKKEKMERKKRDREEQARDDGGLKEEMKQHKVHCYNSKVSLPVTVYLEKGCFIQDCMVFSHKYFPKSRG